MKRRFLWVSFLLLVTSITYGQTNEFKATYEDFKRQAFKEYEDFRAKANKEYAEFLQTAWEERTLLPPKPRPKDEMKPPVVIDEEQKENEIVDNPIEIEEEIRIPDPEPQPMPIAPIEEKPTPVEEEKIVNFELYGTPMQVRVHEAVDFKFLYLNPTEISILWLYLSDITNNMIKDCLELRSKHQLCDWAYLRMLDEICQKVMGEDTNEAEFLKAYIYCQSGYNMRLALQKDRLIMLYGTNYSIYEKPGLVIDSINYYVDKPVNGEVFLSLPNFPKEKTLSFQVLQNPKLKQDISKERILTSSDASCLSASAKVNLNLLKFCEDFPRALESDNFLTHWALYAGMPMAEETKKVIYPKIKEWIKGKSNYEAVDIICHWIQTAFEYEYDDIVWGHDRAFFSEESLYYPFCDCEDRSILLTRIVRDLLGLKCALVYYPGHLATAIALGEDAKGDFFRIEGKKFIVCDPTYIGAPIGLTMEDVDNSSARLIVL